jgi:uncharacterized protein YqhQ
VPKQKFHYGGQAVIEGIMIRGERYYSLAVRKGDGSIYRESQLLYKRFNGRIRRIPFLRGVFVLAESLILGFKVLSKSANLAVSSNDEIETEEFSKLAMFVTLAITLLIGITVFFLGPLFAARGMDSILFSDVESKAWASVISNGIEGTIRLVLLVGYIGLIGMMKDIKRVFAYHGAEHMAIHAYEHNLPLNVENIRKFPTAHPRCGTAFLLTVAVISVIIFGFLGRPDIINAICSRVILIPVIAGISYEFLRLSGTIGDTQLGKWLSSPGLTLQKLTTREPDDQQIEVAIVAMEEAISADHESGNLNPSMVDSQAI